MIPEFPEFKKIELTDKNDVERITGKYAPYSDFNFVSMWCWDISGDMRISILNENLVVRFTDYLTGEPFYSYLGNNNVNETITTLLDFSSKQGLSLKLKLVPEVSLEGIDENKFIINEEPDHFDYVYPINDISSYLGSEYKKHRRMSRIFEKKHQFKIENLDLSDDNNKVKICSLVDNWIDKKKERAEKINDSQELEDLKNESIAFNKLLSAPKDFLKSLVCFCLFVDDELSGFMVSEKVSQNYCLSHFGKSDIKYEGISQYLMQKHANHFLDLGINYHNDEQDLGLQNLRYSKNSYRPKHFLKKFSIALLDDSII